MFAVIYIVVEQFAGNIILPGIRNAKILSINIPSVHPPRMSKAENVASFLHIVDLWRVKEHSLLKQ